jgi:AcrR family transcriptional regulator
MSTTNVITLADRRNEVTRRLILDTAIELLEADGMTSLTMRAVAKRANMSERTVFRYFATREEFLDAVTTATRERMALPPVPRSIDELRALPRNLYEAFEAQQRLVVAGLHSEISDRIREVAVRTRWAAVRALLDEHAPKRSPHDRKIAAATVCHYLGATCWHFHRFRQKLSAEDTIECAELAVERALESLAIPRR